MKTTVQYFKYPRTPHWRLHLTRLGEDGHGIWLGAPAGTAVQRADEPPVTMDHAFLLLIPPDRWWSAIFNGPDHRIPIYVDVTTVAEWLSPDRAEMVDLDLDVVRRRDGVVYVDDEDEFEEHRSSLRYPERMVDTARATAARLVLDVESRRPPFDDTSTAWFARLGDA